MRDEVGDLIPIAISHLQIRVRSGMPFFALPYPHYSELVEHTWLTSIWRRTHQLHITVEVERHWAAEDISHFDLFIMDTFIQFNVSPKQLQHINLLWMARFFSITQQYLASNLRIGKVPFIGHSKRTS
jgi:hypothetical protein